CVVITCPADAVTLSNCPASALTVTDSELAPIASTISCETRVLLPICRPDCRYFLNPLISAVRLYGPGGRNGIVYSPSTLVTVSNLLLVSDFVAITLAFATTAPEGSVTFPVSVDRNSCPAARDANRAIPRRMRRRIETLFFTQSKTDQMPACSDYKACARCI